MAPIHWWVVDHADAAPLVESAGLLATGLAVSDRECGAGLQDVNRGRCPMTVSALLEL
jgi:hypothetical protein